MKPPVEWVQDEREIERLGEDVRLLRPSRVLEIGSQCGGTLWYWMSLMKPGGVIGSVDTLMDPRDYRYPLQKAGHESIWRGWAEHFGVSFKMFEADSTSPETIRAVGEAMPVVDFLFIDGGHDYETVKADFENYSPLVRPGGVIAFHDAAEMQTGCDVARFWREVKQGRDAEEFFENRNVYGIGVLYV